MENIEFLDNIIKKLLSLKIKPYGSKAELSKDELLFLCKKVRKFFLDQPILLELQAPLTICGDIHGQFHDLLRIFEFAQYPPQKNYLFLGDYVDRGLHSIETICLLFAYKIKYPNNFFILRGNHESALMNRIYGFYDELIKCGFSEKMWKLFNKVFNCMPIAAIIDQKIFCVHGGLSKDLTSLNDIRNIERPVEIPSYGLLCDLLWSDPNPSSCAQDYEPNDRGLSCTFSVRVLNEFMKKYDFELICRAHQLVNDGYEFPFFQNQSLVTIFSAPNYCYETNNKGAILEINEDLLCRFSVLEPINWEKVYSNLRQ